MKKQKGIASIVFIIIIIVLLAIAGFFVYQYFSTKTQPVVQTQQNQNQNNQNADWKTYTNTQYGFSFQYPSTETVNLANHVPPHGTDLVLPGNNFIEKDGSIGNALTFFIFQKATSNLEGYISSDLASSNAVNTKYGLPQSSYQKININGRRL